MPTWSMASSRWSGADWTSGIDRSLPGASGRFMVGLCRRRLDRALAGERAEAPRDRRGDALRVQPALREQHRRIAVVDELVRQPEHEQRNLDAGCRKRLGDGGAGAA